MSTRSKQFLYPLGIIVIVIAIVFVLMANKKEPEKKPPQKPIPVVTVEHINLKPITLTLDSQGQVNPRYQTQLVAQANGEITFVAKEFERGSRIPKGTLLAQIDPFNYQVKLEQAKANLASARANFILERAQGQVAEAEWSKITNSEPSELGLRKPQQEQALATVKASEAALKQAQKDLDRTRITAPYDGIVLARNINPGGFVSAGNHIGELADIRTAEVRLPISVQDLGLLVDNGLGALVTLTYQSPQGTATRTGTIIRREGLIDASSRVVYLVAAVNTPYNDAPDKKALPDLYIGGFVAAKIHGKTLPKAVKVPRAIINNGRIPTVENNTLKFVPVDIIQHQGPFDIVASGLHDGQMIVTSPLEYAVDGISVKLNNSASDNMPKQEG